MVEVLAVLFYSLNKVFFLMREIAGRREDHEMVRRWKVYAWGSGLIGLPFVAYILLHERDWIFGLLEVGVAPSMLIGIVRAHARSEMPMPAWVDRVADSAIGLGIGYSMRDLGGLLSFTQVLELIAVASFQLGSYRLSAHDDRRGYLWYLLMFAAAGLLLFMQEHYFFAVQQIGSAIVIWLAYRLAGERQH